MVRASGQVAFWMSPYLGGDPGGDQLQLEEFDGSGSGEEHLELPSQNVAPMPRTDKH